MDDQTQGRRFTPEEVAQREEMARRQEAADQVYLKAKKSLWWFIGVMFGRNAGTLNITTPPDGAVLDKWISEIMGKAVELIDGEVLYKLIELKAKRNPLPLDAQGFVQTEILTKDDSKAMPASDEPQKPPSLLMRQPTAAEEFYLQCRLQSLCLERGVWLPIEVMERIGDVNLDAFRQIQDLVLDFMERSVIEQGARKSAEAAGVPFDRAHLDAWEMTPDVVATLARIGRGTKQCSAARPAA